MLLTQSATINTQALIRLLAFALSNSNDEVKELEAYDQNDVKGEHSREGHYFTTRLIEWDDQFFVMTTSTDDDTLEMFDNEDAAREAYERDKEEARVFAETGEL